MRLEKINGSCIYYDEHYLIYVREYYLYCIELFRNELARNSYSLNLIFGDYKYAFLNFNRTCKVDIQFEHTLVKQGGRDTDGAVEGNIAIDGEAKYLVRISNFRALSRCDLIIDYSFPNLENIAQSGRFSSYLSKTVCISPLLYNPKIDLYNSQGRDGVVTTFINAEENRRASVLKRFRLDGVSIKNVTDCFSKDDVFGLYCKSRILVNVHQTDHHCTLEELRVLPALLCGCIVVSEDVPLKEKIAYSNFIVWSGIDKIHEVVKTVNEQYDAYYQRIFGSSLFTDTIEKMNFSNQMAVASSLMQLQSGSFRNRLRNLR